MKWTSLDAEIIEKKNEVIFKGKIITPENEEPVQLTMSFFQINILVAAKLLLK